MTKYILTARLRQGGQPDLQPQGLKALRRLVSALKVAHTLQLRPVVKDGKVFLTVLARRGPPDSGLVRWVDRQIEADLPGFMAQCASKQAATAAARTAARRGGRQATVKAPLAGVVVGSREGLEGRLRTAFFQAVDFRNFPGKQEKLLREGLPVAGLKNGEAVKISAEDLIDPLAVVSKGAEGGTGFDPRAELALQRLANLRWTQDRVYEGEDVKSRSEELADKEKTFAHADVDLLNDEMRQAAREAGVTLPHGADSDAIRAAAVLIEDAYLRERVLAQLSEADVITDAVRVYFHPGGDPAFRVRKSPAAGAWAPYVPTPSKKVKPEKPFVFPPVTGAASQKRVISRTAHAAMLEKLSALEAREAQLLTDMEAALADGDLSESSFYDETRSGLQKVQHDMRVLTAELDEVEPGEVQGRVGSTFLIRTGERDREVKLTDGEPKPGEVSLASPLGQALLTAKEGEVITLTVTTTKAVPATEQISVRVGTTTVQRHTPSGVRAPALPDTLAVYEQRPVRTRRDQKVTRAQTITLISVR